MRPCFRDDVPEWAGETPRATAIFPKEQCDLGVSSGVVAKSTPWRAPPLPNTPFPQLRRRAFEPSSHIAVPSCHYNDAVRVNIADPKDGRQRWVTATVVPIAPR